MLSETYRGRGGTSNTCDKENIDSKGLEISIVRHEFELKLLNVILDDARRVYCNEYDICARIPSRTRFSVACVYIGCGSRSCFFREVYVEGIWEGYKVEHMDPSDICDHMHKL